jgi:hypothetical protein
MADRTARSRSAIWTVLPIGLGTAAALGALAFAGLIAVLAPADLSVDVLLIMCAVLAMAAVGTLLAIKVPANGIGWLLLVASFLLSVEFVALDYGEASRAVAAGSWPGTDVAIWLYGNLLALPFLIMVIGIPLIYPDGRLLSPRWRWLVAFLVLMGASEVLKWFRVGLIADTNVANPFGIAGVEPLISVFDLPPFQLAGALVLGGTIASVVIRFRRGDPVERAQLKWLLAVTVLAVISWPVIGLATALGATIVVTLGWYIGLLGFAALPVAIGIAVLRYRLYEIDRIISRTLGWAIVTGVLVSVFAGGLLALQATLSGLTQGNTLAVALSTLVAAVLFQPLRLRVQRAVDRRFDRARYDAERTVEAFGERLRDDVALDAVVGDLRATITSSIKPSSSEIWLRPARARPRSADGP